MISVFGVKADFVLIYFAKVVQNGWMIDAEVKWVDWVDDLPTDQSKPNMIAITAGIGSIGSEAADNFKVLVCNPEWVAQQVVANS
ncbi:MAG: hypothetical protein P8H62_10315, partial [Henriciella sp.]|nr:hypothetical protein [Henriciella sp.]